MLNSYPAIVERSETGFSVFFPDLPGLASAGATTAEAYSNAEQALTAHLLLSAQLGEDIPDPSDFADIERDPEVDEFARILVRAERP